MAAFRFGLQRILELRQRAEKESARKLAHARQEAALALEAVRALEEARRAGAEEANRGDGSVVRAGELQRLALLVNTLDHHLEHADEVSREADARLDGASAEFQVAHAGRRALDLLRDKHSALWLAEQERRERALLDAVALARHKNGKANGS